MQKRCRQVFEFYVQLVLPSQLWRFSRFQTYAKTEEFPNPVSIRRGLRKLYRCPVLSGPLESNLVLVDREQTELLWTGPEPKQHLTIAYLSAIATAGLLKLTHTTTHTASHYYILLHKVKNKRPKGLKCQVDRLREVCQSWILLWPGVGPVLWVPLLCHCWPWSRASRQS